MRRRDVLISCAAVLAAPAILPRRLSARTPVINGKRIRRRLSTLEDNDPFFEKYAEAVRLMHKLPESSPLNWRRQALIHADFCAHGLSTGELEFLLWHRPYLDFFERACAALIDDPGFALPYWNWGDNNGRLPQRFFDNGPLNCLFWNDPSNYMSRGWGQISTVPFRRARADFGMLDDPNFAGSFTKEALTRMEDETNYEDFSNLIEGPHGAAHVFTGGHPGLGTEFGHFSHGMSPLDPVFWLHHANVDRFWAASSIPLKEQTEIYNDLTKTYAGMFFDEHGDAADRVTLGDTFNLDFFGYTYDFLTDEADPQEVLLLKESIEAVPRFVESLSNRSVLAPGEAKRQMVGSEDVAGTLRAGRIKRVSLSVEGLVDILAVPRLSLRTKSIGAVTGQVASLENRGVVARLKGVKPLPAAAGNIVKVFVDCPYLSPSTPTTDPHHAGTLSFFSCPPEFCKSTEFTVNLTSPLQFRFRDGLLVDNVIEMQFLSLDTNPDVPEVMEIGSIELIST